MFFNQFPYTDFHELNLDFVLKNYKTLLDSLAHLDSWVDTHEQEYEVLKQKVDDLENGRWSEDFVNTLISWYEANIIDIIGEMVKQVFFGVNDQGYFVAYIPESWRDITFDTIMDYSSEYYGHLTLSY